MGQQQQNGKEVAKKNVGAVSADVSSMFEELDYSSTEAKDLLIPKILLMQGSSVKVKDEATHKAGDIIKSTDGTVYGSARAADAKPLKFIPVYMFKTWVKQEILGKKKQYVETYPVTPENTAQKWEQEEVIDNVKHIYQLTKNINFYVILEKDFGNPLAVPHVLSFRSTSAKAAALIEDWFSQCKVAQLAKVKKDEAGNLLLPFAKMFELSGKLESNDEHSWFIFKTAILESLKDDDSRLPQMFNWYKTVSSYDHTKKVDNSDLDEGSAAAEKDVSGQVKF